jgi:tetratricopeptide (TPR) repeat protein
MLSNPFANATVLGRLSPLNWIKYLLWAVLGFTSAWIRSRRIAYLLLGLPAIISVVVMLTANAKSDESMPISVRHQYLASTAKAIDQLTSTDDSEQRARFQTEAEFYLERLEEGGGNSEERLWQRTRLDAALGRSQRRWEDLHSVLSNQEQSRDVDAHLAIALGLLTGEWEDPELDVVEAAEMHLQQVIRVSTSPAKTIPARQALAKIYILQDRLEEARDQLEPIASSVPEERLRLATVYRDMRDSARAASHAELAVPHFLQRVDAGSEDPADWQQLADAYFLSGKYPEAIDVLSRAMSLPGQDLAFRRMKARFYVLWSLEFPKEDLSQRLQLLESAMETFPSDELVLGALHQFVMESDAEFGDQIEARLEEILAAGNAPVIVHTIIGTRAAQNGDAERARLHLSLALQQGEMTTQVLNNLAHVLAFGPSHDYETALTLIDQALALGTHPRMFDTRGQILARLERWPDAIASLETALRDMPDYAPIHQTLAEAYAAVGQQELAEIHLRRLNELGGPVSLDMEAPASEDSPSGTPHEESGTEGAVPEAEGTDSAPETIPSPALPSE